MNTIQWTAVGYIAVLILAANLPWITRRILFLLPPRGEEKGAAWRILEWVLLYGLMLGLGMGLERYLTGTLHPQGGGFYAITLMLFAVFAFPGFVYHYDLRRHLKRRPPMERTTGG
ncbi:DUF2818 family protein [Ectothiorhodospira mobilis]|uniref:DUF2818 family protein n=1 Tax=Ectothiorhodospira mobilis TaxID=195064 RepID=UPI001908D214|nr:DUF2818 family protein [Ectothiorhodospira mobilis]MBK1691462.1 hypothetical protein [Ectothiorhodospira mobilis]